MLGNPFSSRSPENDLKRTDSVTDSGISRVSAPSPEGCPSSTVSCQIYSGDVLTYKFNLYYVETRENGEEFSLQSQKIMIVVNHNVV